VALGDMNELYTGDYNANNLPTGKLRYSFFFYHSGFSAYL
jgi:hypothetical protein